MIKPIDIQNKEFDSKMRGYDKEQVDDFLDELIRDMDTLYRSNKALNDKVMQLTEELDKFKAKESSINQSIDLTRYQCEEMRKAAKLEADEMIKNAKKSAVSLAKDIDMDHIKKYDELLQIKKDLENFKQRVKLNCQDLIDRIDQLE